jgi:predicted DNA-binding transcriptional regulator YafY
MRVGGIKEVRAWVLGWGADVEVLAPPALRDEVRDHARRMVARYETTEGPHPPTPSPVAMGKGE